MADTPTLEVLPDEAAVAARTAELITDVLAQPLPAGRTAPRAVALSGGGTPKAMYPLMAAVGTVPWSDVHVLQVDERQVGEDDPARNWLAIRDTLVIPTGAVGHPMPLEGDDYPVPEVVDVAQLGIGTDGHTASLIPGDPVLDVTGVDVARAGPYQGAVRLTLTAEAINRVGVLVWQIVGADKHEALERLMDGDTSIPAGLIRRGPRVVVVADRAAARG
ncbi:6-phosphogluconolactonase, eukaryotic type [Euzebya pacifica]|uniref:6-phosphogluconolactonase, eukaryotic type n=1 Tax=Euzebya pacifica TaxID=1608957 RepID=A0A346Y4Q4_9ACTN|nr:6-phosphogluconolactonase [Euzebya pacifica]AXV09451.1 6-phosphogluconolactonase, eukaryotic type [Euzebya pacifica]